jgi:hypothetical protein
MASERAGAAVTAALVPICVERFMGQADAAAKLTEFQRIAAWQQGQFIGSPEEVRREFQPRRDGVATGRCAAPETISNGS